MGRTLLWRSAFRHIVAGCLRRKSLNVPQALALALQQQAQGLLAAGAHGVEATRVLALVRDSDLLNPG